MGACTCVSVSFHRGWRIWLIIMRLCLTLCDGSERYDCLSLKNSELHFIMLLCLLWVFQLRVFVNKWINKYKKYKLIVSRHVCFSLLNWIECYELKSVAKNLHSVMFDLKLGFWNVCILYFNNKTSLNIELNCIMNIELNYTIFWKCITKFVLFLFLKLGPFCWFFLFNCGVFDHYACWTEKCKKKKRLMAYKTV